MLALGDVEVRPDEREVTVGGERVELTGKEFDLLAFLLEHPGIVFSRDQLLDRVWGMATTAAPARWTSTSPSCGASSAVPDLIRTVRRTGYKAVRRA